MSTDVTIPLDKGFGLSTIQCHVSNKDKIYMDKIPYANAVSILIHVMVCCRLDLAYSMSVVSRYMSCHGKDLLGISV